MTSTKIKRTAFILKHWLSGHQLTSTTLLAMMGVREACTWGGGVVWDESRAERLAGPGRGCSPEMGSSCPLGMEPQRRNLQCSYYLLALYKTLSNTNATTAVKTDEIHF